MHVRWHPTARKELFRAPRYYEREVPGLGERFLDQTEIAIRSILSFPESAPQGAFGVRRRRIDRFSYDLVYRVAGDHIQVVAVAHHARKPGYWARRLSRSHGG